jgi:hypothetical protein
MHSCITHILNINTHLHTDPHTISMAAILSVIIGASIYVDQLLIPSEIATVRTQFQG